MKVVLIEDVENLGEKYELKEVADGHARNFLIPKGLVKVATEEAIQWASDMQVLQAEKEVKNLEETGDTASGLEGLEVEMKVKVGDQDQLFEHINTQKIAVKLKELGFNVKKTQIQLEKDIENIGEFDVKVKFEHNLEAQIKVIVLAEEVSAKEDI